VNEVPPERPWFYPLTPREAEVSELIADGLSNDEIAKRMGRSRRTTDVRMQMIMRKLDLAPKRSEIIDWVAEHRPRSPTRD
jgi:DNA-binding NarL/FixJ family response regulator